jgi:hypothetical protein
MDENAKVVSLEERLKGRGKDPAGLGPVQMRIAMETILEAALERMRGLGATPEEIVAKLESTAWELRRKR